MEEKLNKILEDGKKEISNSKDEQALLKLKSIYIGKDSEITKIMKNMKELSIEEKKIVGSLTNKIKNELEKCIKAKIGELSSNVISKKAFDHTLPVTDSKGSLSPVTIVANEVADVLKKMGFIIVSGPEMEDEYRNFEALNVSKDHPARDMQDTYWTDEAKVLRTHTSPVQVRSMEKYGAPLRIAAPGRCFRNEDLDASHENTFFQVEGMVIDKEVSISNLIYVMKNILKEIYKSDVEVRLRPGFFPFVEPGFELDIKCLICNGNGCSTCKNSGWIELCPCGMIHPEVLRMSGIDNTVYSGFAFGIGLTRMAMMKYKINDIRMLNSGDIRSLKQFGIE
ncbi:MAG: phenylalanine--tRNA ligase subunit alpha [Clostridia bacterium]|nr:phenylalanine--tRNA ligase subunit alpha [Clostridia bacterium]